MSEIFLMMMMMMINIISELSLQGGLDENTKAIKKTNRDPFTLLTK